MLTAIETALPRLTAGEYGACEVCDVAIEDSLPLQTQEVAFEAKSDQH